jgi:hypothetical protein
MQRSRATTALAVALSGLAACGGGTGGGEAAPVIGADVGAAGIARGVAVVAVGALVGYGGAAELLAYARGRGRFQRARAVVVGLIDAGHGNVKSRAARFRFTTADGHVIQRVSSLSSFPGPRVGKRLTVVYDPADPERTAERLGVWRLKLALSPLLVAGGVALAALGITVM